MGMNLIDEATEAARRCRDYQKKAALVHYTNQLRDTFGRFAISCSREDMSELVGHWTRVLLALGELPTDGDKVVPLNEKLTDAS